MGYLIRRCSRLLIATAIMFTPVTLTTGIKRSVTALLPPIFLAPLLQASLYARFDAGFVVGFAGFDGRIGRDRIWLPKRATAIGLLQALYALIAFGWGDIHSITMVSALLARI